VYRWHLAHVRESNAGEPAAIECDNQIREWVVGNESLDPSLIGVVALQPVLDPIDSWPLAETLSNTQGVLSRGGRIQIAVTGPPGSGRRSFAATVSAKLGLPLIAVDCDQIEEAAWRNVYERVERHAFLERSAIAWAGESLARRLWPHTTAAFPLQFAICETSQLPAPPAEFVTAQVALAALTSADRESLWRAYVPEVAKWPESELRELNERYRVTPGDIALAAKGSAHSPGEIRKNVQAAWRDKFGGLATPLECSFGWDDLVLDAVTMETLKDIAFEAAHRTVYWEQPAPQRLFPQGRGLTVLLSGPPGTGKTMSAQVIAAELRYDLIRVEMPSMVSKYVGETSQNVERLLQRARLSNVIVLFDEADAFFAKRVEDTRDAQDRHVNTESAYLLQAIESFPGITLLSTNQKSNIDSAFFRRLRFVVDYQKPDAGQRLTIWRKITGELLGEETLKAIEQPLEQIAESVEVTGAQIKNALLGAVFIAQREGEPVRARHIAHSLHRELAKHGRALGTREKERLSRHEP
jgi:adenylate kinase family enzyme